MGRLLWNCIQIYANKSLALKHWLYDGFCMITSDLIDLSDFRIFFDWEMYKYSILW